MSNISINRTESSPSSISEDIEIRRRYKLQRLVRKITPYLFISPFFIGFTVFSLFPMAYSIWLSLHRQNGLVSSGKFIGLQNYSRLLQDDIFLKSLSNTSLWALGMILVMLPVSLGLATLLNSRHLKGREFFKLLYFTPNVTTGVVIAIVFGLIFHDDFGLLNNYVMKPLGLQRVRWLEVGSAVIPALLIMGTWRWSGVNALYFLNGMRSINPDIIEAALIDGANQWQLFRYITFPLLRPIVIFLVTLTIIGSFNTFAESALLFGAEGGPERAGLLTTMFLYNESFKSMRVGYGAAIGWLVAAIVISITIAQTWVLGLFRED
jgi:arabinosaccharide transport system permease protein